MSNKKTLAVFSIIGAACLWGTAGIFVRNLENNISQINIVMGRTAFSALFYILIILFSDKKLFKVKLKDLPWFCAAGVFSIIMFNFCYYKTMEAASLSVAAVLLYTAPFFVVFMAAIFFKEKITFKKSVACIIAFVGCCCVSGVFDAAHKISVDALFFGVVTGLGYALYTIFSEILIKKGYSTLTINFYVFLFAAIGSALITDFSAFTNEISLHKESLWILISMALINTVLPYILYTSALKNIETSKAPIIAVIEPVVATLIGTFVYKERLTLSGILGIILVLGAVIILNLRIGGRNGKDKTSCQCKN